MNEKLEKLALAVRRLQSKSIEWDGYDFPFKLLAMHEKRDRLTGNFLYDNSMQTMKDFYVGKDILITGGSGFIGKVLIEKLLRSSPEGGRIFLLLRSRKGMTPQQRVQEMLDLPLFQVVMTENPDAAARLVAVDGDCSAVGLGLSPADRQTLVDNVSIVFHCAATVRFDLTTNHMVMINVRGTREVVCLCKEIKKLKVFVHVSTAFSNATKDRTTPIPEVVLPQRHDWKMIIEAAEYCERTGGTSVLDLIFEKLGSRHQNNYTFTKALAESLVEDECSCLPTIIVRPTVVIASYEDPFGGWVDNLYGPMSIWDGIGQGVIRVHYGLPDNVMDYVPADVTVKTILVAAWHRGIGYRFRSEPGKVDVVNNGTSDFCQHTYGSMDRLKKILFDNNSHRYILRYPRLLLTNSFGMFWLVTIFSHIPLGFVVDTSLRISGKKPMLIRIYRRLYFAQTKLLHFFSSVPFNFDLENQWTLFARLPESDKGRFSIVSYHYPMEYYQDIIRGIIKYVFREKPYPAHKSNRKIMYIVDWVHNVFLVVVGLWFISWIFR